MESLPCLVELDHGYSKGSIAENTDDNFIWGYDEITWFSTLSRSQRNDFLEYVVDWLKTNDPVGHLEMPGIRQTWVNHTERDPGTYFANRESDACPNGQGQEATIAGIWDTDDK